MSARGEPPPSRAAEDRGEVSLHRHVRTTRRLPTPAERLPRQAVRNGQIDGRKVRRQCVTGRCIVDLDCPAAGLAVEVDGASHVGNADDLQRDGWLATRGIRALRFWTNEGAG